MRFQQAFINSLIIITRPKSERRKVFSTITLDLYNIWSHRVCRNRNTLKLFIKIARFEANFYRTMFGLEQSYICRYRISGRKAEICHAVLQTILLVGKLTFFPTPNDHKIMIMLKYCTTPRWPGTDCNSFGPSALLLSQITRKAI